MPAEDGAAPEEVSLVDETGRERKFRLHDAFDVDGKPYYLVESFDDPDEVLLLREVDGALETVEEEEFERVMQALEHDDVE